MSVLFVDTSFYQALLNPRDRWHTKALEFSREYRGGMVTSEYVLCELGTLMCAPRLRPIFMEFVGLLDVASAVEIVPASAGHFRAGLALFASRPDKEWSMTDCVSFAMMSDRGIVEALAFDHHFEQAGFRLLLGSR